MGGQYLVGYKKPPRDKQFKPGQSGNPKGRPKAEPSITKDFQKALDSRITTDVDGKRQSMTHRYAMALQHTRKAAAGDVKSAKLVIQMSEPKGSDRGQELPLILEAFRGTNAKHEGEKTESSAMKEEKDEPDEHD